MFITLKQPPSEGQPVQIITAISSQIMFAFKQPLQSVFQVAIGAALLPCIGDYDSLLQQLEEAGLDVLDTPEGGKAAVNKEHILFFLSPALGVYSLMFKGKIGMTVKAALPEITGLFEKKSVIVS